MSADINTNEPAVNREPAELAAEAVTQNGLEPDLEQLRQLLADEQQTSAKFRDSWQRSHADFLNLKRRTDNERTSLSAEAREKLLVKLLPVVDDFERALQTMPESLTKEPWINGVMLIEKKLKSLLEQENVAAIPAEGVEFDPHLHEAVQRDEDGEGDKDVVTAVYQKGYKMGDKIIRAAVVKVGRQQG